MSDSIRGATASPGLPPRAGHILRLAEIIRKVDGGNRLSAAALAEAILAHPGFGGCHDGLAASANLEGAPCDFTRALLRPAYEPGDGSADDAQLVNQSWWHPSMGCDSLQIVVDNAHDAIVCRRQP